MISKQLIAHLIDYLIDYLISHLIGYLIVDLFELSRYISRMSNAQCRRPDGVYVVPITALRN